MMRSPLAVYYGWTMRVTGGTGPLLALLFMLPLLGLAAIGWLGDAAEPGPLWLVAGRRINLAPAGLAGWTWLLGSTLWVGYFLWRTARSWVRGLRAGWRNRPQPRADD